MRTDEELMRAASFEPEIVIGKIRFFDQRRGYGFIVADDGGDDVYIDFAVARSTPSTLRGYRSGARVKCRCVTGRRGRRATAILEMDAVDDGGPDDWLRGVVKFYNRHQGYGFVSTDGPDRFVHATAVTESGMAGLSAGMVVEFRLDADRDRIAEIRPAGEGIGD